MNRFRKTFRPAFCTLALLLIAAPTAFAHAHPKTMTPAPDSIGPAPNKVSITFSEAVEPKFSSIKLTDVEGKSIDPESSTPVPWRSNHAYPCRAQAACGHLRREMVQRLNRRTSLARQLQVHSAIDGTNMFELFPTMRTCAAALSDIACAALAGVLLNRLWLGRTSSVNRHLHISLTLSSAVLLLGIPSQFLLLSASMTGDTSWTEAWHALPDVTTTHSGHALVLSFCFVPCFLAFSLFPSALDKTKGILTGIGLAAGLFASRALFGHAASDGDFALREGMQFLHLISIAVWGGGVLVAGLIVVPRLVSTSRSDDIPQFGRRLSRAVTFALVIVILEWNL